MSCRRVALVLAGLIVAATPGRAQQEGAPAPRVSLRLSRDTLTFRSHRALEPGVELPDDIATKTSGKYIEAYEKLTGKKFEFSN